MDDINYYLVIAANPLSDSKAAEKVFRMVNQLDLLSKDVTMFLPGFHCISSKEKDSKDIREKRIADIKERNQEEDYHGKNPVFHTYCESTGDMYFNDVEYTIFMQDMEDECPGFEYKAETELVVLPTCEGKIQYENVRSFSLEPFIRYENSMGTIESFIYKVLRLIQKDDSRNSLSLIDKIQAKYLEMTSTPSIKFDEDTTEVTIKMDNRIMEYMKWKEQDDKIFISYSTKDEYSAFALKGLLEKKGKSVWIAPDGIPSGADYTLTIPAALRVVSKVVVLLSHNSARSRWVRREIAKADSNSKPLFGILLDNFTMEDAKSYDHLDFLLEDTQVKYSISDLFDYPEKLNEFLEQLNQ